MTWMLCVHHGKYDQLERKIARDKLVVDLYRPTVSEPVDVSGKIEWCQKPAFENYLFVSTKIPKTNIELTLTQLIGYVDQLPMSPVILGDWIANVTDEKLVEIKGRIETMNVTSKLLGNAGDFAAAYVGKTVMITAGASVTYGEVVSSGGVNTIIVEIPLFNQPTRCKVRVTEVELV